MSYFQKKSIKGGNSYVTNRGYDSKTENKHQLKEALYFSEQEMKIYKNNPENFDKAWNNGDYLSTETFYFNSHEVEISANIGPAILKFFCY